MVGKPQAIINMGISQSSEPLRTREYIGIYASDANDVIGNNNGLPWSIPEDMAFFRKTTLNSIVIMGRKTFDSLGLPGGLPNRINIVITSARQQTHAHAHAVIFASTRNLERILNLFPEKPVFIIGGAQIFKHFSSQINTWYITKIYKEYLDTPYETTVFRPVDLETDFDKECIIQTFHSVHENCNVEISKWIRRRRAERGAEASDEINSIVNNAPSSEQNAIF